jgi:hypothetical protein
MNRWISVTAPLAVRPASKIGLVPRKRGERSADYPRRNARRLWIRLFGQVFLIQNND